MEVRRHAKYTDNKMPNTEFKFVYTTSIENKGKVNFLEVEEDISNKTSLPVLISFLPPPYAMHVMML